MAHQIIDRKADYLRWREENLPNNLRIIQLQRLIESWRRYSDNPENTDGYNSAEKLKELYGELNSLPEYVEFF